jgi:hypothetical protein
MSQDKKLELSIEGTGNNLVITLTNKTSQMQTIADTIGSLRVLNSDLNQPVTIISQPAVTELPPESSISIPLNGLQPGRHIATARSIDDPQLLMVEFDVRP